MPQDMSFWEKAAVVGTLCGVLISSIFAWLSRKSASKAKAEAAKANEHRKNTVEAANEANKALREIAQRLNKPARLAVAKRHGLSARIKPTYGGHVLYLGILSNAGESVVTLLGTERGRVFAWESDEKKIVGEMLRLVYSRNQGKQQGYGDMEAEAVEVISLPPGESAHVQVEYRAEGPITRLIFQIPHQPPQENGDDLFDFAMKK